MAHSHALPEPRLVVPPAFTRRRPRRWALWALLGLLIVGAAVIFALRVPRKATIQYRTAPVVRRTVVAVVEATGHLDVTHRVEVPVTLAGRLAEIFVEAGTTVDSGQPLAQIDETSARAVENSARAKTGAAEGRVAEARAAADAARDIRERTLQLAERGLASDGEVASVRAAEAKAQAALKAARAELSGATASASSAELERKSLTIRAPIAGTVLSAPKWPGGFVGPDKGPLFTIGSDTHVMRIDASVAEADIGSVRAGQSAHFTVPAFPDRSFPATVEGRSTEPDRNATVTSYVVTLNAPNPDRVLLSGMTATVRIEVARAENVFAVREPALRFVPNSEAEAAPRSRVFRISDGDHLVPVNVKPGISDAAYTEIEIPDKAALHVGDLVVMGYVPREGEESDGPGIKLGNRQ